MKLLCFSVLLVLSAVSGRRIGRQYGDQDVDFEQLMRCYQSANIEEKCPTRNYPLIRELQGVRGPPEVERVMEGKKPKDICDGAMPYLECAVDMIKDIPEDCRDMMFAQAPITYEEAVEIMDGLVGILNDICENDLDFIEANSECYGDHTMEARVQKCSRYNPCTQFNELNGCVADVMRQNSACSSDAVEYFTGILQEMRNVFNSLCTKTFGNGFHALMNFARRIYK